MSYLSEVPRVIHTKKGLQKKKCPFSFFIEKKTVKLRKGLFTHNFRQLKEIFALVALSLPRSRFEAAETQIFEAVIAVGLQH